MPFMKWVKTPAGYEPVEMTEEEVFAENAMEKRRTYKYGLVKREKEKKMEFDKSRCYTSLNADELRAGDKVIVADRLSDLKILIQENAIRTLKKVKGEDKGYRFDVGVGIPYALAYLVERNCTDQEELKLINPPVCDDRFEIIAEARKHIIEATNIEHSPDEMKVLDTFLFRCWQMGWLRQYEKTEQIEPKTEQKAEGYRWVNYRPFKDTDELVKVWNKKFYLDFKPSHDPLTMPHIWVRQKECSKGGLLITYFGEDEVKTDVGFLTMSKLLNAYTFTDGSVCGVEE